MRIEEKRTCITDSYSRGIIRPSKTKKEVSKVSHINYVNLGIGNFGFVWPYDLIGRTKA